MKIIKKIIRETMEWEWVKEITVYPSLQELFDNGEIKQGDLIVLRGMVEHGKTKEMGWINDFPVIIEKVGQTLNYTDFTLYDENRTDVIETMGLSSINNIRFLKSDGKLEVISKNNKELGTS